MKLTRAVEKQQPPKTGQAAVLFAWLLCSSSVGCNHVHATTTTAASSGATSPIRPPPPRRQQQKDVPLPQLPFSGAPPLHHVAPPKIVLPPPRTSIQPTKQQEENDQRTDNVMDDQESVTRTTIATSVKPPPPPLLQKQPPPLAPLHELQQEKKEIITELRSKKKYEVEEPKQEPPQQQQEASEQGSARTPPKPEPPPQELMSESTNADDEKEEKHQQEETDSIQKQQQEATHVQILMPPPLSVEKVVPPSKQEPPKPYSTLLPEKKARPPVPHYVAQSNVAPKKPLQPPQTLQTNGMASKNIPQQQRHPPQQGQHQQQPYSRQQQQYHVRPQVSNKTARWKQLWNRVERGLDDLADLEGMVAHGAKRVLHQATTTLSSGSPIRISKGSGTTKPSWNPRKKTGKQQEQKAESTKSWNDLMAGKKRVIRAGASSPPPSHLLQAQQKHNATLPLKQQPQGYPPLDPASRYSPMKQQTQEATSDKKPSQLRPRPEWPSHDAPGQAMDKRQQPGSVGPVPPNQQQKPQQSAGSKPPQDPTRKGGGISATQGRPGTFPPKSRLQTDVDLDELSPGVLSKVVGVVTAPIRMIKRRSSSLSYGADAWKDRDEVDKLTSRQQKGLPLRFLFGKKETAATSPEKPLPWKPLSRHDKKSSSSTIPMTPTLRDLLDREGSSLLSTQEVRSCHAIGRNRAVMDVLCLGLILIGFHEMLPHLRTIMTEIPTVSTFLEFSSSTVNTLTSAGLDVFLNTWAPFCFVAAFLMANTNSLIWNPRCFLLASIVGGTVQDLTQYSQLYLRLVSSLALQRNMPELSNRVAALQAMATVESWRLQTFVVLVLTTLFVVTVSVVRPIIGAMAVAAGQLVTLSQWRQWPVPWSGLGDEARTVFKVLGETLRSLLGTEQAGSFLREHPKRLAFQVSVLVALVAASRLPNLTRRRKTFERVLDPGDKDDSQEEEAAWSWFASSTENINKLGISSASRLSLQTETGAIEGTLERWRIMKPRSDSVGVSSYSFKCLSRLIGYSISAALVLVIPIALYGFLGISKTSRFDSVGTDLSILFMFSWGLVWNALSRWMAADSEFPAVRAFLETLSSTVEELSRLHSSQGNMQIAALVSHSKGIVASDLWAAHASKRAWAVKGANLACRSGDVLVVLGDDGSGKTRLLTSLVEAMTMPPKRALTTTKVRGTVTVGGIEVSKWDKTQLKRRLGLVLNDVRTVTDLAELMSGLTLEEILEPLDSMQAVVEPHNPGARERSAMSLALKITGLATTLLPRLPSKLSTVVSANEDDLKPSPLRPRASALSPAEWAKVLLTKVLAQAIYDNDNQAKSHSSIDKCLMGSVLILDDVTAHMSESEESRFVLLLKCTGAATILSSNRWATGRLGNRIIVIKDGAVVESGVHNDLLRLGPQHGAYASHWHAMSYM